jgi:acetyl-CoA carboxylase carboxyl transferase subunit alpha
MADAKSMDFEAPLENLRQRIDELRSSAEQTNLDLSREIESMQEQYQAMARRVYANLTAWQEVQVARHELRPQTRDYLRTTFSDFVELHGDRCFGDDAAIVTGFSRLGDRRVLVVGEHKGRTIEERHQCWAGCPHPEGYRKALAKMRMAEKFSLPIIALIDTKGAYPGTGGEERGVGPAIALNLREMSRLRVPVVIVVIGEGGSGGALGIGVGDRVLMLQHAYYSVISPEGCAAILWRDAAKREQAAEAMRITSRDLSERDLIDEVIMEPIGGAHKDPEGMARILREALARQLDTLTRMPVEQLLEERYKRIRAIGEFEVANEMRLQEILTPDPPPQEEPAEQTEPAAADSATPEGGIAEDADAQQSVVDADTETGGDTPTEDCADADVGADDRPET